MTETFVLDRLAIDTPVIVPDSETTIAPISHDREDENLIPDVHLNEEQCLDLCNTGLSRVVSGQPSCDRPGGECQTPNSCTFAKRCQNPGAIPDRSFLVGIVVLQQHD